MSSPSLRLVPIRGCDDLAVLRPLGDSWNESLCEVVSIILCARSDRWVPFCRRKSTTHSVSSMPSCETLGAAVAQVESYLEGRIIECRGVELEALDAQRGLWGKDG